MSNFNRYKSHPEGSNRHLHEPVKALLHSVQEQILGNGATNPPRSDEPLAHPENVPQRGGNSEILQWMESTIIQTSTEKYQGLAQLEKRGKQGRSPSNLYQQARIQPVSPRSEEEQEKEVKETIFPKLQYSKNPKICHGQCLHHGQDLDGIQGQRVTKNEKTPFPKPINLSPDVLNTLAEIKNSILPLKNIKNSLLYFKEINSSLLSLTKISEQNKKEINSPEIMWENNKPNVLINNTNRLIQGQQELYKYIRNIKKSFAINYDISIDNLTEKLNKLSIYVEEFEEKTSSH
ncbi:hypothetical protein O181_005834 [Austropuccinia psidii MF-1]|uniref:Uncharacterized protein n=1 Tax=Austropuccinia psidii MF-1 TaxID=1389203 RepID=A0A9Q3GG95_9BASI|nr:hypothetical protein [Austropuccinia psidii MF-1]